MIKYVQINDQVMAVSSPETATLENVKAAAVKIDAKMANSTPYLDGETVKFRINSGTKGADLRYVKFKDQTMGLTGSATNDPKAIQAKLVAMDASAANMDYKVVGDTIEFFYRAGTKGQ